MYSNRLSRRRPQQRRIRVSRSMRVKIFRGQHKSLRENVADAAGPVYRTTTRKQLRNVRRRFRAGALLDGLLKNNLWLARNLCDRYQSLQCIHRAGCWVDCLDFITFSCSELVTSPLRASYVFFMRDLYGSVFFTILSQAWFCNMFSIHRHAESSEACDNVWTSTGLSMSVNI